MKKRKKKLPKKIQISRKKRKIFKRNHPKFKKAGKKSKKKIKKHLKHSIQKTKIQKKKRKGLFDFLFGSKKTNKKRAKSKKKKNSKLKKVSFKKKRKLLRRKLKRKKQQQKKKFKIIKNKKIRNIKEFKRKKQQQKKKVFLQKKQKLKIIKKKKLERLQRIKFSLLKKKKEEEKKIIRKLKRKKEKEAQKRAELEKKNHRGLFDFLFGSKKEKKKEKIISKKHLKKHTVKNNENKGKEIKKREFKKSEEVVEEKKDKIKEIENKKLEEKKTKEEIIKKKKKEKEKLKKQKEEERIEKAKKKEEEKRTIKKVDEFQFIQTGIEGLDKLLGKGIPQGASILVEGGPGSGKTIFCLELVKSMCKKGKKVLYMSFEEPEHRLRAHLESFGTNVKEYENKHLLYIKRFNALDIARSVEALLSEAKKELLIDVQPVLIPQDFDPDVVLIDSLTSIGSAFSGEGSRFRIYMEQLFRYLESHEITSFLIRETSNPTHIGTSFVEKAEAVSFLSDGIIALYNVFLPNGSRKRALEVIKMRGVSIERKIVECEIQGGKGLIVYHNKMLVGEYTLT